MLHSLGDWHSLEMQNLVPSQVFQFHLLLQQLLAAWSGWQDSWYGKPWNPPPLSATNVPSRDSLGFLSFFSFLIIITPATSELSKAHKGPLSYCAKCKEEVKAVRSHQFLLSPSSPSLWTAAPGNSLKVKSHHCFLWLPPGPCAWRRPRGKETEADFMGYACPTWVMGRGQGSHWEPVFYFGSTTAPDPSLMYAYGCLVRK